MSGAEALERLQADGDPYPRRPSPAYKGLGLGEFFVVVMVTLVFGALVSPMFVPSRYCDRRSSTLSNAKQLALGSLMYASDHDERLPPAESWMDATTPYVKNDDTYRDPSLEDRREGEYGFAFYAPASGVDMLQEARLDLAPLLFQSSRLDWNAHGGLSLLPRVPRGDGRHVVAFMDCHAKRVPADWRGNDPREWDVRRRR